MADILQTTISNIFFKETFHLIIQILRDRFLNGPTDKTRHSVTQKYHFIGYGFLNTNSC